MIFYAGITYTYFAREGKRFSSILHCICFANESNTLSARWLESTSQHVPERPAPLSSYFFVDLKCGQNPHCLPLPSTAALQVHKGSANGPSA